MKKITSFLILLFLFPFGLFSQNTDDNTLTDCDRGLVLLSGGIDSLNEQEKPKEIRHLDVQVNLFEDFNFENEPYHIIYVKDEKDPNSFYNITEKGELLRLQKEYRLKEPASNHFKNCGLIKGGI